MSRRDEALRFFDKNEYFMSTVVDNNIERYRKGDAVLNVTDRNGVPVSNARIRIKQKTHEFKYGANIFMLDEMESDEKNQKYKDAFKDTFNIATVPFYWSDLEPEQGKPRYSVDSPKIYRRPATDLCVDFCLQNGVEPKCHCLNYINFTPSWILDATWDEYKCALNKRMKELAERYADKIPSWDVTNETLQEFTYPPKHPAYYFEDDFVEWSFRCADRYFPNNRLVINDYYVFDRADHFNQNRSAYYMQIERLLRCGITHLDSIGMQFHSFFPKEDEARRAADRYDPVHLYRVLDRYAKLGKSIQITEMTIPAYSGSVEDEAVRAELLEKLYTLFFSHPAMEAIIYWNLVDGYAHVWDPNPEKIAASRGDMTLGENRYYGGLMRFDLSKKPAYDVIYRLFAKKWHTEADTVTDEYGRAGFRGFFGDYELEIEANGKKTTKTISLLKDKNNISMIKI